MDRLRAWGVLALLAGLGSTAAAAEPESLPSGFDRGTLAFNRWNAGQTERPKPPPVPPQVAAAKIKAQDTAAPCAGRKRASSAAWPPATSCGSWP